MKEKFEAWLRRDIYKPGEEAMNLNAEAARKLQNSVMTTALKLPGRF